MYQRNRTLFILVAPKCAHCQFKHILLPNFIQQRVGSQVLTTLATTLLLNIFVRTIPFALLVANNIYKKNISLRKHVDLFSSVFKKNIPNNTTPTFQELGGVTQPLNLVEGIRISHGLLSKYSYYFVYHCFRTSTHS